MKTAASEKKRALPPGGWRSKIHYKAYSDPEGYRALIHSVQLQSPELEASYARCFMMLGSPLLATALPYEVELCR